jgi:hypothetical protein
LDWIYIGFLSDGSFVGYSRLSSNSPVSPDTLYLSQVASGGSLEFVPVDSTSGLPASDAVAEPLMTIPDYDPRTRPWYLPSAQFSNPGAGAPTNGTWSDVYAFALPGSPLGLTLSVPLFESPDSDVMVAVAGTDYLLSSLSETLRQRFPDSERASAFILEDGTHRIIASSFEGEDLTAADGSRLTAEDSTSQFVRQTTHWLVEESYIPPIGHLHTRNSIDGFIDRTILNHIPRTALKETGYTSSDFDIVFWSADEGLNSPRWIIVLARESHHVAPFITKELSPWGHMFILICSLWTGFISLFFLGFTLLNRNTNILKISQPTFLGLLSSGGLIFAVACYYLIGVPSDSYCRFYLFLPNVAFTFCFSCLLWKIHRAYLVAQAVKNMKKISFSNADVYLYIGSVTALDLALNLAAFYTEGNEVGYEAVCLAKNDDGVCFDIEESLTCVQQDGLWVSPLFKAHIAITLSVLMKGVMISFGLRLAWVTKRFDRQYAESTALLLTCYTISISSGFVLAMHIFVGENAQLQVWAGVICYNVTFSFSMLFLPRMFSLFWLGDITLEELYARTQKLKIQRKESSVKRKSMVPKRGSDLSASTAAAAGNAGRTRTSPAAAKHRTLGTASPMREVKAHEERTEKKEISFEAAATEKEDGTSGGTNRSNRSLTVNRSSRGKSVFALGNVAMGTDMDEVLFEEVYEDGQDQDGGWQIGGESNLTYDDNPGRNNSNLVVANANKQLAKRKSHQQGVINYNLETTL